MGSSQGSEAQGWVEEDFDCEMDITSADPGLINPLLLKRVIIRILVLRPLKGVGLFIMGLRYYGCSYLYYYSYFSWTTTPSTVTTATPSTLSFRSPGCCILENCWKSHKAAEVWAHHSSILPFF